MIECAVTSSLLIAVLIILRFLFRRKISRRLQYALWGIVLLRLLLPFSLLESPFSIMNAVPDSLSISEQTVNETSGNIGSLSSINSGSDSSALTKKASAVSPDRETRSTLKTGTPELLRLIWLTGTILVGLWILGTNRLFYRRLHQTRRIYEAVDCKLPVYISESIASPCLFGIFRPAVYLTAKATKNEESCRYVLAHELCHYHHGDHIWSLLRSLCLAIYWWNPLVWAAAILSRTDSELACDEAVIRQIGEKNRLAYGHTLVDMIAVKQHHSGIIYAATMMVSGQRGIKERLNMIVKNPPTFIPALAIVLIVVIFCLGLAFTAAQTDLSSGSNETFSAYAEQLYADRNQYIGNASADGALLQQTMGLSGQFGAYTFELETEKEPYILRVVFNNPVADPTALDKAMRKNALLLLALIDNASEVQWQYNDAGQSTGQNGKITGSLTLSDAQALLNYNIKSYGQSAGQVQSLLDWLNINHSILQKNPARNDAATTADSPSINRTDLDACIAEAILSKNAVQYPKSDFAAQAHTTLRAVESGNMSTVYAMALYLQFGYENGEITETGGSHMPVAMTFEKNAKGEYHLKEYWMPQDGADYVPSIQKKFPSDIYEQALDTQKYVLAETQTCYAQAIEAGKVNTDAVLAKLIKTISSSPAEASNSSAYIDAHPMEYRELLYYGNYTLRYAYSEFLKGGQTGLSGHIMLSALRELLGGEDLKLALTGTPQEWFEEFKKHAVDLRAANSMEFMEKNYPKTTLLLQMLP